MYTLNLTSADKVVCKIVVHWVVQNLCLYKRIVKYHNGITEWGRMTKSTWQHLRKWVKGRLVYESDRNGEETVLESGNPGFQSSRIFFHKVVKGMCRWRESLMLLSSFLVQHAMTMDWMERSDVPLMDWAVNITFCRSRWSRAEQFPYEAEKHPDRIFPIVYL